MPPPIRYTVTATLPTQALRDKYTAWLRDAHLQDVINAGADSAEMVLLDADPGEPPHRVQSSYRFTDRTAFDRYVNEKAPALRAEGLALFGPDTGVSFSRSIGEILTG